MIEAQPLPPERPKFKPLDTLQTRMLYAASDLKNNLNAINPKYTNVPEISKEGLKNLDQHDYTLFDDASTNERRSNASVEQSHLGAEVQKWAEKCSVMIKNDRRSQNLKNLLGINPDRLNAETMKKFYSTYFKVEGKDSDIHSFVKFVIKRYSDTEGKVDLKSLNDDLGSIQWFASVFGRQSAEVVTQLIAAEAKLINDPDNFVQEANQNKNIVVANSRDEELLKFLWHNRRSSRQTAEPIRKTATPPIESDPGKPQEPLPEGEFTLTELFQKVKGPVNKNQPYFVENPPESLNLSPEQMDELNLVEPFFIVGPEDKNGGRDINPNRKAVPYTYDLGEVNEKGQKNPKADRRFVNAENATYGDSGLFAVAAASADTPEKQAKLYHALVDGILKIHIARFENSGRPPLYNAWDSAQQVLGRWKDQTIVDSLRIFEHFDKLPPEYEKLRPENERLLPYDDDEKVTSGRIDFWWKRAEELKKALESGKLKTHHLRWIELLSHSVKTPELIKLIQKNQPININVTSVEPGLPSTSKKATILGAPKPEYELEKVVVPNDPEAVKRHWGKLSPGDLMTMSLNLNTQAKGNEFRLNVTGTGITQNDLDRMAAYQKLAADNGYNLGPFRYDRFKNQVVATLSSRTENQVIIKSIINSTAELIEKIEKTPVGKQIEKMEISERGLLNIVPSAILEKAKSQDLMIRMADPQVNLGDSNFSIDPTGDNNKGTLKGKISASAFGQNAVIMVEFKNSDAADKQDVVPISVDVDPPALKASIEKNLKMYSFAELLREHFQNQLEARKKSQRKLQKVGVRINPNEKTLAVILT